MKVLIHQIPESGRDYEVTVNAKLLRERLADRPDILHIGECRSDLHIERVDQVVDIRGTVLLDVEFACSRCAEELEATLRFPLRMVMLPRSERPGPVDEDENTGYHDGRVVNLGGIIREQIALQMPNVLLCDRACKGICPVCNANLNEGPCRCGAR